MSDATSGGQYQPWREAANQGNLLSYLWQNRPEMRQLVPGYTPDEPWYQKALDIGSVPARMLVNSLRQPVEATQTALHSPALTLDPEAQRGLSQAIINTGMLAGPFGETPGLPSFPAWHGSRHVFEPEVGEPFGRFREEKINTGEGAQVFGWGHYIAGEQSTAKSYRTAGASRFQIQPTTLFDSKPIDVDNIWTKYPEIPPPQAYAINQFHRNFGDADKAVARLQDYAAKTEQKANEFDYEQYHRDMLKQNEQEAPPEYITDLANRTKAWDLQEAKHMADAADWLKGNKHRLELEGSGNLYQVWVRPEHHEFLDWDKPWEEQSQSVQDVINKYFPKLAAGANRWPDTLGQDLYYKQADLMTPHGSKTFEQRASEALDQAGIPGIKFLDQGSRGLPKVLMHEGKEWQPYSDAERIASYAIHQGPTPHTGHKTWSIRDNAENAWHDLNNELDFGNFNSARAALGPNYTAEGYERATHAAMDWLGDNAHKLTMGDHPDSTYNYVVFHHRNINVIDRNGRIFGFQATDRNPFTGEPIK